MNDTKTANPEQGEFTHYLSAWLYCTKAGIALDRIKKVSFHVWKVEGMS